MWLLIVLVMAENFQINEFNTWRICISRTTQFIKEEESKVIFTCIQIDKGKKKERTFVRLLVVCVCMRVPCGFIEIKKLVCPRSISSEGTCHVLLLLSADGKARKQKSVYALFFYTTYYHATQQTLSEVPWQTIQCNYTFYIMHRNCYMCHFSICKQRNCRHSESEHKCVLLFLVEKPFGVHVCVC